MPTLKHLLAPPVFEDETKSHQAFILHYILLVLVVVPAASMNPVEQSYTSVIMESASTRFIMSEYSASSTGSIPALKGPASGWPW